MNEREFHHMVSFMKSNLETSIGKLIFGSDGSGSQYKN